MTFEAKNIDMFLPCTKCLWKNRSHVDTNPVFKSFFNDLCPNRGPLQEININRFILPTLILLPLFGWGSLEKI